MSIEEKGQFSVHYVQVMDKDGNIDMTLHPNLDESKIKELYHLMMLLRVMDEKCFNLQRSGKIGTYAQTRGQEASEVGSAFALEQRDWAVPSFREMGVFIVRGVDKAKLIQGWNGDTRAFANPDGAHNLPLSIPIASQLLHAVGLAWAAKLQKKDEVVMVYFGDGATSEGDFHEAMNFAGVYKLPIVFFNQNNQWAISTPRTIQTATQTIAQKAIAYGFEGVQVDGNDVLGVYRITKEAIEKARRGEGPTLIEALTFRMGDHTTSDDAAKYRDPALVEEWKQKDPLLRLEKYFQKKGTWSDEYKNWVVSTVTKEVEDAVAAGLSVEAPSYEQLFDDVFAEKPWCLVEQQQQLKEELEGKKE